MNDLKFGESVSVSFGLENAVRAKRLNRGDNYSQWLNSFAKRSFQLRMQSGRYVAYTFIPPESDGGWLFQIGQAKHVYLARRRNPLYKKGSSLPQFNCPLVTVSSGVRSHVDRGDHVVVVGDKFVDSVYDMAYKPYHGHSNGSCAMPSSNSMLMRLAIAMENRMVEAVQDRSIPQDMISVPRYWAQFKDPPPPEENKVSIEKVLAVLSGDETVEELQSPGGTVAEVSSVNGRPMAVFNTNNGPVFRNLIPSGYFEPSVQPGTFIEAGARIGYFATPRYYPSWGAAKRHVLGEDHADYLLQCVVSSFDVKYDGYIYRDIRLCANAVKGRKHITIWEDFSEMVDEGNPVIQVLHYNPFIQSFHHNGADFTFDVWGANQREFEEEELGPTG